MVTNGQLTTTQRTGLKTAPGQQLEAHAAAAWDRMWDAVLAEANWAMKLTDSYRPLAVQERVFLERYKQQATGSGPYGDVRHWNGKRYVRVNGAAAAIPGTSNHGLGLAVDISDVGGFGSARYKVLSKIAPRFGWSNAAGRTINEYWHWEYDLDTDPTGGQPVKARKVTIKQIKAMQVAVHTDDDGIWGKNTDTATMSVRAASRWGGSKFPWGYDVVQRAMGREPSGKWGPKDLAAHDKTVARMQKVLGVDDDGRWGPKTEAAFQAFRAGAQNRK